MRFLRSLGIVALLTTQAAADPTPDPPTYVLQPVALWTPRPQPIAPSLRLEAARVINERFGDTWRYPDPGTAVVPPVGTPPRARPSLPRRPCGGSGGSSRRSVGRWTT